MGNSFGARRRRQRTVGVTAVLRTQGDGNPDDGRVRVHSNGPTWYAARSRTSSRRDTPRLGSGAERAVQDHPQLRSGQSGKDFMQRRAHMSTAWSPASRALKQATNQKQFLRGRRGRAVADTAFR